MILTIPRETSNAGELAALKADRVVQPWVEVATAVFLVYASLSKWARSIEAEVVSIAVSALVAVAIYPLYI